MDQLFNLAWYNEQGHQVVTESYGVSYPYYDGTTDHYIGFDFDSWGLQASFGDITNLVIEIMSKMRLASDSLVDHAAAAWAGLLLYFSLLL